MNKNKTFKLRYLSSLVMLNLGLSYGTLAAEETITEKEKQDETEVIVVSGIRGSLIKSQDIKMDANTIVDAITSEDIGKFPDQNVAESLQRITGVAIDSCLTICFDMNLILQKNSVDNQNQSPSTV